MTAPQGRAAADVEHRSALRFEPGSEQKYSNAGYIVLGLVIEKLSGMSYPDFIAEEVLRPLGMNDTGLFELDAVVARRAVGYTRHGEGGDTPERRANFNTMPARGSSAGGGYSTASDLLKLAQVMHQERPGGRGGVGGGAPGINAAIQLAGDWTAIVLSNYDPPAAEEVAMNTLRLVGVQEK